LLEVIQPPIVNPATVLMIAPAIAPISGALNFCKAVIVKNLSCYIVYSFIQSSGFYDFQPNYGFRRY
jgi:hypothetical protein